MSKEPAIMNKSFQRSEVQRLLTKFFKVRVAEGTQKHSIIFPKSSSAFLIQPICEIATVWPPRGKYFLDDLVLQRIDSFLRIHRNAYIFLTSNGVQSDEILVMDALQVHFTKQRVLFLPSNGSSQCVSMIKEIVCTKSDISRKIEQSKKLSNGFIDENFICDVIGRNLKISAHDTMVLQDGCQTLSNISNARVDQLMEYSLSVNVACKVHSFFHG